MTAPARKKKEPTRVVEAHRLVLLQGMLGSPEAPFWFWSLWDENMVTVAGSVNPIPGGSLELFTMLCAAFDLVATPEHYARRFERGALTEVQGAGGRWFSIEEGSW